jgi:hypothetical protein
MTSDRRPRSSIELKRSKLLNAQTYEADTSTSARTTKVAAVFRAAATVINRCETVNPIPGA